VAPYQPDYKYHGVSAALEFAVKILKVENIVVLGHTRCAGIKKLLDETVDDTEFLGPWMRIAQRAKDRTFK
jgi:carbonic anhydrase